MEALGKRNFGEFPLDTLQERTRLVESESRELKESYIRRPFARVPNAGPRGVGYRLWRDRAWEMDERMDEVV